MKENSNRKKAGIILQKLARVLLWLYLAAVGIIVLHYGRRIFVADRFRIPSWSMAPTLVPGDHVWVNKLLFGARLYTSLDFQDHAPLKSIRMPGLRKIRPGDIIVFNFPFGFNDWSKVEFKINYVFCKRVLGTPGDTISIVDGINRNHRFPGIIGIEESQKRLGSIPDSILAAGNCLMAVPLSHPIWTVRNLGPLYVPQKGTTVRLDSIGRYLYQPVIEYETGQSMTDMQEYTFQQNWYFAVGDNCTDSQDSRYWGFIPEDFIIGIVVSHLLPHI